MFPAEKPIVLNTLARGVMVQSTIKQGMWIMNLMYEQTLNGIAESAWEKFRSGFTNFGTASAGLIRIVITFRVIKFYRGYNNSWICTS